MYTSLVYNIISLSGLNTPMSIFDHKTVIIYIHHVTSVQDNLVNEAPASNNKLEASARLMRRGPVF